ncbi:MAG TPA: FAD-dependent oxidoreductase [Spirochaetia bacterium]|nr:FAD-dependent oxidoreductase [Spirochaetia bacterium]
MDYDILVIGSGIGGMEAALKLGDMGYRVLLVEKEASIGGKIILLSKVFPTLDCASCISTPKMAGCTHHPNVRVLVYSEVEEVKRELGGGFTARIRQKPTFVDPAACTGCRQCETNCSVAVPDQFNFNLGPRRAAYLAFPQAVPQKAVIEREGSSPCTGRCPAGIKAHGYVALVRTGKYREAFDLIMEATPLVGSLGRACYAPCEGECTRGTMEGPVPIRRLKRFVAERRYQEPVLTTVIPSGGPAVAVVGSGPAGLTCAFQLAKKGYRVKVFEAAAQAGGMLTQAIPAYRLPREVVARDIQNVTGLGVEIETGVRVENLAGLKEAGFDAVFVATGTPGSLPMGVPGEDRAGVMGAMDFLRRVNTGEGMSLTGRTILVAGGGNVAIDSARVAKRQGAARVMVLYRRDRESMPAHTWEIEAAEREGVEFHYLAAPVAFTGPAGKLAAVECIRMGAADSTGRPVPVNDSQFSVPADLAVVAIGLSPETGPFEGLLPLGSGGSITADRETLQTAVPYIFAGGDVVTGPSMIVDAAGQGRRAAFYLDRYLRGEELTQASFDDRLPVVDREQVIARQKTYQKLPPVEETLAAGSGIKGEELPLTEEEARYSAGRCLDCGVCAECHQCVAVCPAHAVRLDMREEVETIQAGAVVLATGFRLFDAALKPQYGYGKFKNVISGMQMDRLLAPTRPYNAVLRPSDGKVPDNIAFVMCTGSRDQTVDNPLCSRVCCMYSVKHNQLMMGALPLADVTVYYIDIRAFGKGYEEFYHQAAAMGTNFVQGRVAGISELANGNLMVSYEDVSGGGGPLQKEHDLVVLATGLLPNTSAYGIFAGGDLALDEFAYVREVEEDLNPGKTSIEGVFVAGSVSGARDIPDSILHAGAAAAQAAAYVERIRMENK